MEVHRILEPGLLEIVYKDALAYEFKQHKIPYEREKKYKVSYKDIILPHYFFADFVIYEDIILEVKAVSGIVDQFIAWTLNYMALANSPVGLIVNFGTPNLPTPGQRKFNQIPNFHRLTCFDRATSGYTNKAGHHSGSAIGQLVKRVRLVGKKNQIF